jgi:RNA polymerase sigma factor (sigma-70 family)
MANVPLSRLIRHLRRLSGPRGGYSSSDSQLLERFVGQRDEAAFEVVVWRHGPMVLSVCRRLLRHEHDAEDAFQATFLALVRKAGSIGKRQALASWLYKVAYRVALKARERAEKRAQCEKRAVHSPIAGPPEDVVWRDLRPVLDDEVSRLPERFRVPIILCYLEGKTVEETARQLGCPVGTVLSRLARGRERLRMRLVRRGLALSAGVLGTALAQQTAAALPGVLVDKTVEAGLWYAANGIAAAGAVSAPVAALTKGVLNAMWLSKLKVTAAVVLAVGIVVSGASVLTHRALVASPSDARKDEGMLVLVKGRGGAEAGKKPTAQQRGDGRQNQ